jgi:phospholipid-transporting ATPase
MKINRNSSDSNGVTVPLLDPATTQNENDERIVQPFLPLDLEDDPYPPNIIITSRYSLFSFFPKTIFEQFRRLANVYFLVLGGIAAIGANTEYYDTAVEPAGLLIPMSIVVFISIIKDGLEDLKRHQTDHKTNNRLTRLVEQDVCLPPCHLLHLFL